MQKKVEIKGLFFDIDGVLVDVSRSHRRSIEETVEHFIGRPIVPGTIDRYKEINGYSNNWELAYDIITDTGMGTSYHRVVSEFQRRYRGDNWEGFISEEPALISTNTLVRLYAGNRIMGIVTGRLHAEAQWTLKRFGWNRYFPLIVPNEKMEGRKKADPYPLLYALAVLDAAGHRLTTSDTVYVSDTVDGIKAARSAGLWSVGLVPQHAADKEEAESLLRSHGAHAVLSHADGLPPLIDDFSEIIDEESNDNND